MNNLCGVVEHLNVGGAHYFNMMFGWREGRKKEKRALN